MTCIIILIYKLIIHFQRDIMIIAVIVTQMILTLGELKSSNNFLCLDYFWPMGSMHCNTNKSVPTPRFRFASVLCHFNNCRSLMPNPSIYVFYTVLFQTIQFSISMQYQFQKRILFQRIQFSINTQFSSIWPIDRTLSGSITLGEGGTESNENEN